MTVETGGDDGQPRPEPAVDPAAQDKALAVAEAIPSPSRVFREADSRRTWAMWIVGAAGVVMCTGSSVFFAWSYYCPPRYAEQIYLSGTAVWPLVVTRAAAGVAGLAVGYGLLRMAYSLSLPLLIEEQRQLTRAGQKRETTDSLLNDFVRQLTSLLRK